jgi:hypothetical protein
MVEQKWDQTNTITGTNCCAAMGAQMTLEQKQSKVINIHFCILLWYYYITKKQRFHHTRYIYIINNVKLNSGQHV